jgi:hypothetical protein
LTQPCQPVTSAVTQPREYPSGVELEEALAVAAGLADMHPTEPSLGESAHAGNMGSGSGPHGAETMSSEIHRLPKPAYSAIWAWWTRSAGLYSSQERK